MPSERLTGPDERRDVVPAARESFEHGDWAGLVVFVAATSWDAIKMPDQHMAERLARYAPVLYVDPPLSVLAPWRRPELASSLGEPRLRALGPRLLRLTPLGPPLARWNVVHSFAGYLRRRAIAAAVRRLGNPPVHAVVSACFADVFGYLAERRRVFYSTDDFVAGAELIRHSTTSLVRLEQAQLRAVDTIVACSPGLVDRYRSMGLDPRLVPNGCDDTHFAGTDELPDPPDVRLPQPVAGFVGHLTERIDFDMLDAVAERGRSLLLVGPTSPSFAASRLEALLRRDNVQWVGPKPFSSLPSYVKAMHVGLLPYTTSAFNQGSFPLKVLEYLAAGRAAVATDLRAVRWLESDLVEIATTPSEFADAVDRAMAEERTPELVAARRALGREHSWDRRAAEMAGILGLGERSARRDARPDGDPTRPLARSGSQEGESSGMTRWHEISSDPMSPAVLERRRTAVRTARRPPTTDRIGYLRRLAAGRRVLDIGVVDHDLGSDRARHWLHGELAKVASGILGIDVLPEQVDELRRRGYAVENRDITTGDLPSGTFDLIVAGEVIEHLDRPGHLFTAAGQLLEPDGRLVFTTPNPYALWRINQNLRDRNRDNVDHVTLISPWGVTEFAERAGLRLESFRGIVTPPTGTKARLARMVFGGRWAGLVPEAFCESIIYEVVRDRDGGTR